MSTEDYRRKLAEFLATRPETGELTYEQIVQARSREELGISSLNMILVLMGYIDKYANGTATVRPEWVSRLDDVDDIASVLREIDAGSLAHAQD
jgi:hypothetical protein